MDHVHGGVGKRPEMVVVALDCRGRECRLTGLTERTVPGLAYFGGNGDALGARPPCPGRCQALPETGVCCRKVVAYGYGGSAIRECLHGDLLFMAHLP